MMWQRFFVPSSTSRQLRGLTRNNALVPKNKILSRSMSHNLIASHSKQQYSRHASRTLAASSCLIVGAVISSYNYAGNQKSESESIDDVQDGENETTDVINWSGTHKVTVSNKTLFEPETVAEVEGIIKACNATKQVVRPLGSSLSPNGIALNSAGMISMANLDKVLEIDTDNKTVTVEAGITVQRVIEALRPHGLTLPNLASIAEQQFGGFVQVGAHGTGRLVAPVDNYVTRLKLVTPGMGTVELTKEKDGFLFEMAKVGVGCLGVVVEVTMECIPAHRLVEHTFVLTRAEAKEQKDMLLKKHKHMRYMWIPYTDAVVVVTNDPEDGVPADIPRDAPPPGDQATRSKALIGLLEQFCKEQDKPFSLDEVQGMGFGELRDALLAFDPLDIDHVKRCNQAEAEFWASNEGYQTKPSDQLLQFDCGGQQWVFEVCFPTGTQEDNNGNDIEFMENLLQGIEDQKIPAHSPIEQRWSASSSSLMSPAHGAPDGLHSWVGIINYLPSEDEDQRSEITKLFTGPYSDLVRSVGKPVSVVSHWAKLETPQSVWKAVDLKLFYQERFPVEDFNKVRAKFDPNNILSNPLLDLVLGKPSQ